VSDRYGTDVLAGDWRTPPRGRAREVAAETGLVVEDVGTVAKTLPDFTRLWQQMPVAGQAAASA